MQQVAMSFDGSIVEVAKGPNGEPLVGIRSVCIATGVDSRMQIEKLRKDSRFNLCVITSVAQDGKQRELVCLPLNQLNGWLFSINPNKVHESIRAKLIAYQQECFDVLYRHFLPKGEASIPEFMLRLEAKVDANNLKLDSLLGMNLTIFGDDAPVITELIGEAAKMMCVTPSEVWGLVRRECDVSSYKLQNRKVINFLRKLTGKGLSLAPTIHSEE